jgi:hypothetical protein
MMNRTTVPRYLSLTAALLMWTAPVLAQEVVPIRFERGATGSTINGTIQGDEYIDYVLNLAADQTMYATLTVTGTNGNGSAFFNVLPAGQDFPALYNGSTDDDRSAEVTFPETGDWAIRVYLMGNDRDTNRTVGYSIDVRVESSGAAPAGGTSAAGGLLPEEDIFVVRLSDPSSRLNVHNAPRQSGTIVGTLPHGTSLANVGGCTMSDGEQWCEVQAAGGGVRGWVSARFLALPR